MQDSCRSSQPLYHHQNTMIYRLSGLVLLLGVLCGCAPKTTGVAPSPDRTALLEGTVTYRERIALPQDAVLEVWIADVSPLALTPILAETAFLADGKQVPLSFELWYDPRRVDSSRLYAVHAVIRQDGQILYRTPQETAVLTQGNPTRVDLVVVSPSEDRPQASR
jgi:putative lipoprotein